MKQGNKEPNETVILLVIPTNDKLGAHNLGSRLANPDMGFLIDSAVHPKDDELATEFCRQMVAGYENTMTANDQFYWGVGTTDVHTEDDFNGVLRFSAPRGWEFEIVLIAGHNEKNTAVCILPTGTEMVRVIDDLVPHHPHVEISADPVAMRREPEKQWVVKLVFERNDEFEDKSMRLKSITTISTSL